MQNYLHPGTFITSFKLTYLSLFSSGKGSVRENFWVKTSKPRSCMVFTNQSTGIPLQSISRGNDIVVDHNHLYYNSYYCYLICRHFAYILYCVSVLLTLLSSYELKTLCPRPEPSPLQGSAPPPWWNPWHSQTCTSAG